MSDPIVMERKDLLDLLDLTVHASISETFKILGIKPKDIDPFITQNAAVKLLKESKVRKGLPSLHKAMFTDKTVRYRCDDITNPYSRKWVSKKDVLKLANQ
jgi:hypothetical protein